MAKTIFKYLIEPNSIENKPYPIKLLVPKGGKPVSLAKQNNRVCVWFEADPTQGAVEYILWCLGTGLGAVPEGCKHLGTVVDDNSVWHVYDGGED